MHTHSNTWHILIFSTSSPHGLSVLECSQTPGWRQRWRDYPRLQSAGSWPLGTSHGSHRRNPHLKPEKNSKDGPLVKIFNPQHKLHSDDGCSCKLWCRKFSNTLFWILLLLSSLAFTFIVLTRLAVVLATSLADCTKCLLATGLAVLEDARRQALQSAEVCFATMVAADRT